MASGAPHIKVNGTDPLPISNKEASDSATTKHPEINGDITNDTISDEGPSLMPIAEHPIENFRRMRVICIGAGFSGIYIGIRVPERLRNIDLQIYEKNDSVGGTWEENRYPGVACDIPSHSYVYSFEPNRNWKGFYASGSEIQKYLDDVAEKYSVKRFIKCGHKVTRCEWDDTKKKWMVNIEKRANGEIIKDEADFIVSARGGLNDYAWPQIEGLRDFRGTLMHSAAWDQSVDFRHKKVGVIGSGSSAIQIVPNLQPLDGIQMSCFVRGRTWIAQSFGESSIEKLHIDHQQFTEEDREAFLSDEKYHAFRKLIETEGNAVHAISIRGSEFNEQARKAFTDLMRKRLKKRPELAEYLIPRFAVGCRRLTPGPGFLEALTEDNVDFIPTPIRRITASGIELENGRHVDLDVLVCATGFHAMAAPPFPVIGKHGQTLRERFTPYPTAYMSLATDGFPNFMMMLGPNSGVGSGSLTKIIESLGDYVVACVRKLQREDIAALSVKPARARDWSAYVDAYFPRTVYLDDCKSWYRADGGRGTRVHGLWPGSTLHAIEALRSVRWEDYDFEFHDEPDDPIKANRLRWLGNGWSELQLRPDGDMSFYIEPEFVDFPASPLPEKTKRWSTLSYSY